MIIYNFSSYIIKILTLLSLLLIVSCGDEPTSPSYGKIEGVVIDAITGEPINSAMIFTEPGTESVITGVDGKFTLNSIDVGNYTVRAVKSKYKTSYTNIRVLENKNVNASILLFPGEGNINLDSLNENRPPSKPVAVSPKNDVSISGDFVELRWSSIDPDDDAITYNLYFDNSSVAQKLLINKLNTSKYIVSDLKVLTKYYWKVEAIDEYGNKSMSNVFSFYVDTVAKSDDGDPKIEDGLLTYISFNGEIKDNSGKTTLEYIGVTTGTDRNGLINNAGNFNQSKNIISLKNIPSNMNNYTIAMWINPTEYFGIPYLDQIHLAGRYGGAQSASFKLQLTNQIINISHYNNGNHTINTNYSLEHSKWTHLCITFDGSFLKTYINGTLINNSILTFNPNVTSSYFTIGMELENQNRIYNGLLDEFYLFNRAISQNEVQTLFTN